VKLNHTMIAVAIGLLLGLAWQLFGNPNIRALRRAATATMNGHDPAAAEAATADLAS